MKAVVFDRFGGPLEMRDVPDPPPPEDGVVVEMRANGICRSDWHAWMGHDPDVRLPHVLGHELAGVVAAVGPKVRRWNVGDRITAPFALGCGVCPCCRAGDSQVCPYQYQPGFTGWGAFAQLVALPHADTNLVRLPESIDFVSAAALGCRFATAFRAVVAQGRTRAGEWLAVHGCGGLGLAALMIGNAIGASTVGVDVRGEALDLARKLGVLHLINARRVKSVPQLIHELTDGGAHVSLDALGSPETCRQSIACLRPRGRHVQVGLLLGEQRAPAVPMDRIIALELELLGSHGMAAHGYEALLGMIEAGRLDPGQLVQRTVSLEGSAQVLSAMGQFETTGVVVIDRF